VLLTMTNTQNTDQAAAAAPINALGRYYIAKDGVEKELPLSCGISTDFKPRLSLSSIAWRCNRMATADLRPQIVAQGINIKLGTAWSAEVTIADGTKRTVGYKLLTERPAALRSFTRATATAPATDHRPAPVKKAAPTKAVAPKPTTTKAALAKKAPAKSAARKAVATP
jgi:hypothetical protein